VHARMVAASSLSLIKSLINRDGDRLLRILPTIYGRHYRSHYANSVMVA